MYLFEKERLMLPYPRITRQLADNRTWATHTSSENKKHHTNSLLTLSCIPYIFALYRMRIVLLESLESRPILFFSNEKKLDPIVIG